MPRLNRTLALCLLGLTALAAQSQAQILQPPPQNVLQLSASASLEVQQDLLTVRLTATREGADANAVQSQLKSALDAALAEARPQSQAGQFEPRTGQFSLYPRYTREGRISGWTGTAELLLEGRDFARITRVAGRIQTMTLGGVSFNLSREERARAENEAQSQAIERFKARADDLARGFGFSGYGLREVSVGASDQGFVQRPRLMAAAAAPAGADAAVPVEAGRTTVTVTVSGSIQLR